MRVSASKLAVLRECQWWARAEVDAPDDPPSKASETGKYFHSLAECALSGDAVPAPHALAEVKRAESLFKGWGRWWANADEFGKPPYWLRFTEWHPERVYLYDWRSGATRLITAAREWYEAGRPREATEIPTVVDLVGLNESAAVVADYKTGSAVEPAATNPQTTMAAVCVADLHGVDSVQSAIVYPRSRDPFKVDSAFIDSLTRFDFKESVRSLMERAPTSEPRRGAHCYRCPAKKVCPALQTDLTDYGAIVPAALGDETEAA